MIAIAFREAGSEHLRSELQKYERIYSSTLLEAEFRSAMHREKIRDDSPSLLAVIEWVLPDRRLMDEIEVVLSSGYLRGADLWHLAVALYLDPARESDFLTLDARQRAISASLGFGPR
jgi:hypothetical protein